MSEGKVGRSTGMRRRCVAGVVVIAAAVALTSVAVATPGFQVAGPIIAEGTVPAGLDVKVKVRSHHGVQVSAIKGPGRAVVQQITVGPGGHTGWHTHGGPAVAIVKRGALTVHDADDPTCSGTTYSAGQAFVDPGDGHIHIGRNLGDVPVEVWVTYLLPAGAAPRLDAPDPGSCPS